MSESRERDFRKPLVISGLVAGTAGIGWLTWGLIKNNQQPKTINEALARFGDEDDKYYIERHKVLGRLLVSGCTTRDQLLTTLFEDVLGSAMKLQQFAHELRVVDQVVDELRADSMGEYALLQIATSRSCRNTPPLPGPHYEPTNFALRVYDEDRLGTALHEVIAQLPKQ